MADIGRRLRCAVYTRKSTEEGLDQAFNSLDAQREACAAYVLSQQHEGWTLLPDLYDDGGYSGGTIERPGLQQLLTDVRAGRVDVVVVYKIDRLTRSLTDFAKIVEVLDQAKASFVSVTQAFNTTNSMGRLTLNVLLSFAQFEREDIAERIRDKIAASKARGIWMGGSVPLGYRVEDRKLVIVPEEASTVRAIMERYIRSNSVRELLSELERDGIVTARRTHRGRGSAAESRSVAVRFTGCSRTAPTSGRSFTRVRSTPVSTRPSSAASCSRRCRLALLSAPVRARLAARKSPSVCLLVWCSTSGGELPPVHTRNHGRRYRYYASNSADDATPPLQRLPAGELEAAVRSAVAGWLADPGKVRGALPNAAPATIPETLTQCSRIAGQIADGTIADAREQLQRLDLRVTVVADGVTASIRLCGLLADEATASGATGERIELSLPTARSSYGLEPRVCLVPPAGTPTRRDDRLVDLIVLSFAVREQLIAMTQAEVSTTPETTLRHLERTARLSYLDPDIISGILDGTQPRTLTTRGLSRMAALPLAWSEQRTVLGFPAH